MSRPRMHDELEKLFESKDSANLTALIEHPLLHDFINEQHLAPLQVKDLVRALTHSSFSHEYQIPHQETCEFLGDAVLQLIMTQHCVSLYPEENEGQLSKLRSTLVNEKSLSIIARGLGLGELLLLGKGEYRKGLQTKDSVLSDSLEAVIAQMYLVMGLEKTQYHVLRWYQLFLPNGYELSRISETDFKSRLQEATLAKYKSLPMYTSDHVKEGFIIQLWIEKKLVGEGLYPSKKLGERDLAEKTLKANNF